MRSRLVFVVSLVAIVVIAALWLRPEPTRTTAVAPPGAVPDSQPARSPEPTPANAATEPPAPVADESTTDATGTFRTDAAGELIIDEQTRLAMEALLARAEPGDATQNLPPAAAADASALLDRYQNYSKAQRQAYPPGAAPATEEAALAELEGLHALRVAHFGAEIAHALYGDEEALTRSLIELMRLEKDQGMTMEEKAARAQQLYDTLPELSRVQRSD